MVVINVCEPLAIELHRGSRQEASSDVDTNQEYPLESVIQIVQ